MLGKRRKEAQATAQKDGGKPKWKEELAEDEESGEEVTAEDMEEWRQREEIERKAREAREAEEAKKRRESERAAAAAEEERKRNARSKSKSSGCSSSCSHRSRSRRRRRSSSSSSRSSSKTRRKSGWDVADTSLIAAATGVPTSETMLSQAENKPLIVVPPPPPPVARLAGDASPLAPSAQATPTPPLPPGVESFFQTHTPAPPPPPPPVHLNGAVLNAPVHGQMWEKLPVSHQGPGHMAHSVMQFPGAVMAPQWHPNMQWQPSFCQGQTGSWQSQAAPLWHDPLQGHEGGGWPQQGEPQSAAHYPAGPAHVFPQPPQNVPSWAPADRSNEERFIGRVKRFQDGPAGGYGFIDCDETKLRFTRDIYIHRNQMIGLQIGDEVSFTISLNNKGEPQARNVMKREDALLLRAGAVHGMVPEGPAGPSAPNLMDEHQARQFQASLRGNIS
eukprot:s1513_g10.t1